MLVPILLLLLSAGLIYLSCEFFVNGVEWVGQKLGVGETAVGTLLAAFGTALPESVVSLVAVTLNKDPAKKQIGVGAALGGPLVLSTIAYAVVGLVLISTHKKKTAYPHLGTDGRLARDQSWFIGIFVCKVALGLVSFAWKPWLGFAFVAAYGVYVFLEMRNGGEVSQEELEPLKLRPAMKNPGIAWPLVQVLAAMAVIFVSSQLFVAQLEHLGPFLGIEPGLTALLLSPVATELPETMNAIIWVRQGKEKLALANISGAMMIQATIPSALGIFFTSWRLDAPLLWAAAVTLVSISGILLLLRLRHLKAPYLAGFGLLYGVFAAGLFLPGIR